jgi:hypothetical protein
MLRVCCLLLIIMLLMTGSVLAQSDATEENASPLLDMLVFVPDTPATRVADIYYASYTGWLAVLAERTPIVDAATLLECLRDAECPHLQTIFSTLPALTFQDLSLRDLLASRNFPEAECVRDSVTFTMVCDAPPAFEAMPDVMGFSPFDIQHSLEITPPDMPPLLVVAGDFDREAINTALTARGYAAADAPDGVMLWCVNGDCDAITGGLDTVDTANLFGGRLGALHPLALVGQHLLDSASVEGINLLLATQGKQQPSLANAPDIQAAAEALNSIPGKLIQANIDASSAHLSLSLEQAVFELAAAGTPVTDETLQELAEPFALWREIPVPPYNAMVMADYLDAGGRLTVVALVFDDADTAATAAARIPQLLDAYTSFAFKRPAAELIRERAGSMATEIYTSSATGKTVLLLQWLASPPEAGSEADQAYLAGGLFPLLFRFRLENDLGWLASNVILPD